jgi:small subunit ribosomal protein S16
MAVKIRLARRGRRKSPFYHIVVADVRAPRDGKFIEKIGSYNPMTQPATIELDNEKVIEWMEKGAQPTDTARAIMRFKGVLYRQHLLRGVKKGALTQEQADKLYQEKLDSKQAKVEARVAETLAKKEAYKKTISGTAKAAPVVEAADQETQDAFKGKSGEEE